jgi:FAD/FMN-containing dehydrogenase
MSSELGLFSSVLGHVGDGNFHQMIMYNPNVHEEVAAVKKFVYEMMQKAIELEGTVSVSKAGEYVVRSVSTNPTIPTGRTRHWAR